jgi:hypothetical protein
MIEGHNINATLSSATIADDGNVVNGDECRNSVLWTGKNSDLILENTSLKAEFFCDIGCNSGCSAASVKESRIFHVIDEYRDNDPFVTISSTTKGCLKTMGKRDRRRVMKK